MAPHLHSPCLTLQIAKVDINPYAGQDGDDDDWN